jgi:hypothetical protein
MHTTPGALTHRSAGAHASRWALLGGLVAGTLDIVYACVFWAVRADVPAQRILQSVAAGLLGPASSSGGWATAVLGLFLHYVIALTMSVTYLSVSRRVPALVDRPVPYGAAYGLLLYAIMNAVVVPLSRAAPGARDPIWIGLTVVVHMLLIGVPIALCARRAAQGRG